jgi:hypothetical protein
MDESNNAIFTHAKMEYTAQLVDVLTPNLFDGIKSIYDESKTVHRTNNPNNTSILILFRLFLEKVPTWSNEVIETETNRIIDTSDCDWLNDLITAVFISHTKILTAIGNNNNSNIELIIPKTINFIHKCYINIAREIWKNPYLFDDYVSGSEYQKNMRTVELLIKESIENTIRKALPVKEILKQQLDIYDNNEKKGVTNQDIRKMLLEELKSLKNDNPKQEETIEQDEVSNDSNDNLYKDELRERINNIDPKFKMDIVKNDTVNEEEDIPDNDYKEDLEKDTTILNETNEPPPIEKNNYYESHDGYVSPDEEEIKGKCENLSINTIPDIGEEQEYDNVDIYSENNDKSIGDKSLLESYLDDVDDNSNVINKDVFKDSNNEVVDNDNINVNIKENIDFNEDPLFKISKKEEKPLEEKSPEEKPLEEKPLEEKPPEEKEIISVNKNDDTETVDLFFEDVSNMLGKKGIDINKDNDKYTLFDDAIIEEEGF